MLPGEHRLLRHGQPQATKEISGRGSCRPRKAGNSTNNDLAGYPRQPRMPDKIPARGWKSQGKYPPRTTLPRTRHTSGRNDLHLGIIYQTVSIDYDRLFFGNMSFVHDIRRAELIASLVHDIRREEMICIDYLFERSEFLIDTPHKKNLRVCPRARVK